MYILLGLVLLALFVVIVVAVLFCLRQIASYCNGNHRKKQRPRILRCIKVERAWLHPFTPEAKRNQVPLLLPHLPPTTWVLQNNKYQVIPLIVTVLPFATLCDTHTHTKSDDLSWSHRVSNIKRNLGEGVRISRHIRRVMLCCPAHLEKKKN